MSDLVESGYWPATVNFETLYMVDLFTTYEDLKITAPRMSRQAFVSMLECRTKLFGRVSGLIISYLDYVLNNCFIVRTCSYNPQCFSTYFLMEPFLRPDHCLKPTFFFSLLLSEW